MKIMKKSLIWNGKIFYGISVSNAFLHAFWIRDVILLVDAADLSAWEVDYGVEDVDGKGGLCNVDNLKILEEAAFQLVFQSFALGFDYTHKDFYYVDWDILLPNDHVHAQTHDGQIHAHSHVHVHARAHNRDREAHDADPDDEDSSYNFIEGSIDNFARINFASADNFVTFASLLAENYHYFPFKGHLNGQDSRYYCYYSKRSLSFAYPMVIFTSNYYTYIVHY